MKKWKTDDIILARRLIVVAVVIMVVVILTAWNYFYKRALIIEKFYHTIERSKVRSVKCSVQEESTFTAGPTIILYIACGEEREYYEGEYFNEGYTEVLHADSEVTAQYEYGWRKYNRFNDTMILFSNQELYELMEMYASRGEF